MFQIFFHIVKVRSEFSVERTVIFSHRQPLKIMNQKWKTNQNLVIFRPGHISLVSYFDLFGSCTTFVFHNAFVKRSFELKVETISMLE